MSAPVLSSATGANLPAPVRPSPKLRRIERVEILARRAEELQHEKQPDVQLRALTDLVAEMARELYRLAHALDGVV